MDQGTPNTQTPPKEEATSGSGVASGVLFTEAQRTAITASGNVLVTAGAGTGKTRTLVARCVHWLKAARLDLDQILVVTFTDKAAAELRLRLRKALEQTLNEVSPGLADEGREREHWERQLALFDRAHLGTLHGFCLRLVREHFHELGLDPQAQLLEPGEARQLADDTLTEQFERAYAGTGTHDEAFRELVRSHGSGRDEPIRELVKRLYHYSQTRPDAAGWLAEQTHLLTDPAATVWIQWFLQALNDWSHRWRVVVENLAGENAKAAELSAILRPLQKPFTREVAAGVLRQSLAADIEWPKREKIKLREPLKGFFEEATFLNSLAGADDGVDPLQEDWSWSRGPLATVIRLTREFTEQFAERKRSVGGMDFHDLEQFALTLLWQPGTNEVTELGKYWRDQFKLVFVDEYQDINAAQDRIITALAQPDGATQDSTEAGGNRFLVGDAKQSIYRFRLAEPYIFREYARSWQQPPGHTVYLSENFRSDPSILQLVNDLFSQIMGVEVGGLAYDENAALKAGRTPASPTVEDVKPLTSGCELWLYDKEDVEESEEPEATRTNASGAGAESTAAEAQRIATYFKGLMHEGLSVQEDGVWRNLEWGDLAILLRSPRGRAEIFAREFERAGVPMNISRGCLYDCMEVIDLISLLQILDNPLQDIPCLAVLRSPLVGLTLAELAAIRMAGRKDNFWSAMERSVNAAETAPDLREKLARFLERYERWRRRIRAAALSPSLEAILEETGYTDWLVTREQGSARQANVNLFLQVTHDFDQRQQRGLFRFLQYLERQQDMEAEPDTPAPAGIDAVTLMSIHQSKGLEFPVVVLAGLEKKFNDTDLRRDIILDETYGLCARVKPPGRAQSYPSLPYWLAQKRQKLEMRGEELRLLYVAMTRARERLVLSVNLSASQFEKHWLAVEPVSSQRVASSKSFADWLGMWFGAATGTATQGANEGIVAGMTWRWIKARVPEANPTTSATLSGSSETLAIDESAELLTDAVMKSWVDGLNWTYPHAAATQQSAKTSVSTLVREEDATDDEADPFFKDAQTSGQQSNGKSSKRPGKTKRDAKTSKLSAMDAGAAHHKFLQHLDLTQKSDLLAEAERMVREQWLTSEERDALDWEGLAQFWESSLGREIVAQPPPNLRRELPFTARFTSEEIMAATGKPRVALGTEEFIVVQGVADLVVLTPVAIWLLDFKTDAASGGETDLKMLKERYAPQIRLYAKALEKIYARPVTRAYLHFLSARKTVEVSP